MTTRRESARSDSRRAKLDDTPGARGDANVGGFVCLQTLAAYAGLSVRTLRAYLRHPVTPLPHFRVGGKILVRRSEYDAWMLQFRERHASLDALVTEVLESL